MLTRVDHCYVDDRNEVVSIFAVNVMKSSVASGAAATLSWFIIAKLIAAILYLCVRAGVPGDQRVVQAL
jgi:hypothetical protein